jgi:ABC-type branched-subunit amino acid transport system ATPase component
VSAYALETQGLSKSFGALRVTDDVALKLPVGARHALIGPNGAGKSTLINLLAGTLTPESGRIFLGGDDITRLPTHRRVRCGRARTFQITTLFPNLTPLEAVTLAVAQRRGEGASLWRSLHASDAVDEAHDLLARLGLGPDMLRPTHELAYGRQRLVEIALGLAEKPKVLLLDEPAAGVPEAESAEIFSVIAALPDDVAVLFIEHDVDLVFRFARHITVLVSGRIFCEGTPDEIARDPEVRRVYLGGVEQ